MRHRDAAVARRSSDDSSDEELGSDSGGGPPQGPREGWASEARPRARVRRRNGHDARDDAHHMDLVCELLNLVGLRLIQPAPIRPTPSQSAPSPQLDPALSLFP